jgi:hypothetical protein
MNDEKKCCEALLKIYGVSEALQRKLDDARVDYPTVVRSIEGEVKQIAEICQLELGDGMIG